MFFKYIQTKYLKMVISKKNEKPIRLRKLCIEYNVSFETMVMELNRQNLGLDEKQIQDIDPILNNLQINAIKSNFENNKNVDFNNSSKEIAFIKQNIQIWQPIQFNDEWKNTQTSKLDDLAPSWFNKRKQLREDSIEYQEFINRLKRQHAIETGIVERLYDLKEGITQTFIKEGFIESYLQHGDTNIPSQQLFAYLKDHIQALDFVFEIINQNRNITKSFILELHQLITQHQNTTDAIDSFGNNVKIPLLKGQFKIHDNNPKRSDGTIFKYCPPIHVDTEIKKLIAIYSGLEEQNIKPVIIAAWFHHAFTQIHPFQDGNGRLARLLASLILIKHNLFPFTVKGSDKKKYIESLESGDKNEPQLLVDFFCSVEKRYIEEALNLNFNDHISKKSLDEVTNILKEKIEFRHHKIKNERFKKIEKNRQQLISICDSFLNSCIQDLYHKIKPDLAKIFLENSFKEGDKSYWFSQQIIDYAIKHDYFYNRTLPRTWFKISILLPEANEYQLVISVHHYGYGDSTIAIGAFLEYTEQKPNRNNTTKNNTRKNINNKMITSLPLDIKPHIISLDVDSKQLELNLKSFLQDTITITISKIISEL